MAALLVNALGCSLKYTTVIGIASSPMDVMGAWSTMS